MRWAACLFQGACARLLGRPAMLSLSKFPELCAPAWTCNPALLELDTGTRCSTTLEPGIAQTLGWYRENGWL